VLDRGDGTGCESGKGSGASGTWPGDYSRSESERVLVNPSFEVREDTFEYIKILSA
jgi:hypothetical protein